MKSHLMDGVSVQVKKNISVRRLEQIRRLYPKVDEVKGSDADSFRTKNNSSFTEVQQIRRESDLANSRESVQKRDVSFATNTQKLQQFVSLAKSIDWPAIQECRESKEILASMPDMLGLISLDFSR